MIKKGSGLQRFGGDVTVNQTISVAGGTAIFDGAVSASAVNVAEGAAIGGSGAISTSLNFVGDSKLAARVVGKTLAGPMAAASVAAAGATITVAADAGWKGDACVLRVTGDGETLSGVSFAKGDNIGALRLSADGTELWATARISAMMIVIR